MAKIQRYQPERNDMLINTDWGIPENEVSKEKATQENLVLLENRWVSEEQRVILTKQAWAYQLIRIVGVLVVVASILMFLKSLGGSTTKTFGDIGFIMVLYGAGILGGFGLYFWRPWARILVIAMGLFWLMGGLMIVGLAIRNGDLMSQPLAILTCGFGFLILVVLFGRHARMICAKQRVTRE
jgi:hypothetical protein